MKINARHIFVDQSGNSSLETNLSGLSIFCIIAALIVNTFICFSGVAVAETEGLGWQKRYPDRPYFLQVLDPKTPNQGENNVEEYYFKTYQESPFVLGGDCNINPAVLVSSGFLVIVDAVIVAVNAPTCSSNTYDFFVVSRHCYWS